MKKEIIDKLSGSAIKELTELKRLIRKLADENIITLTLREMPDQDILAEFIENRNGYAFVIKNFAFNEATGKTAYTVYFRPTTIENVKGNSRIVNAANIKDLFDRWRAESALLDKIKEEYYNIDSQFYDEQFNDFFTNEDEDAATNPFDNERQELIGKFLLFIKSKIKSSPDISNDLKEELITEIAQLNNDVSKITKKRFVYKFSQLAKKLKMAGNKLFQDVFDVAKKELIKKVLYEGVERLPEALHKVQHWMELFKDGL